MIRKRRRLSFRPVGRSRWWGSTWATKHFSQQKYLEQLNVKHGPVNDFVHGVAQYLIALSAKFGHSGNADVRPAGGGSRD